MKAVSFLVMVLSPFCCIAGGYKCVTPSGIVMHQFEPCEAEGRKPDRKQERRSAEPAAAVQQEMEYARTNAPKDESDPRGPLDEINRIRREAREKDPAKADRICDEAKVKERLLLDSDPLAERLESPELFYLRNLQDLYCEEYEAKILPQFPRALP